MTLLYLETNYLMGVATGRYPPVDDLIPLLPSPLRIFVPDVCYMESLAALEAAQTRRNEFKQRLDQEIHQIRSGIVSSRAMRLLSVLETARLENNDLANEFQERLFHSIDALAARAQVIRSTAGSIRRSVRDLRLAQPTDNLIFHLIVDHAKRHEGDKAMFTANIADFSGDVARAALTGVGINRFLRTWESLIGWLASLSRP